MRRMTIDPTELARDLAMSRLIFDPIYDNEDVFVFVDGRREEYTPLGMEIFLKHYNNYLLIIKESDQSCMEL